MVNDDDDIDVGQRPDDNHAFHHVIRDSSSRVSDDSGSDVGSEVLLWDTARVETGHCQGQLRLRKRAGWVPRTNE